MNYSSLVEDYFFGASHVGMLDIYKRDTLYLRVGTALQSEYFDLYLQVNTEGGVLKACFKARGNPYLVAGLEWICEQLEKSEQEMLPLSLDDPYLEEKFEIPRSHYPTAVLLKTGYQEILKRLREKRDE